MHRRLLLAVLVPAAIALLGFTAHAATPSKCAGHTATIVGTPGDDEIRGTPGRDVIIGLAGDDKIAGWKARDVICGNAGRDTLEGGPGEDHLSGGFGTDDLRDGRGDDLSVGGPGPDALTSAASPPQSDTVAAASDRWDDRLNGGTGEDELHIIHEGYVNLTRHVYLHDQSHDRITGIEDVSGWILTRETIIGNARDNLLDGGTGRDVIRGRAGDDTLFIAGSQFAGVPESGQMDGGPGSDWLDLLQGGDVDLRSGTATSGGGHLSLTGIENVRGAGGTFAGNSGPNILMGGGGADTLLGRRGDDILTGRLRDDNLDGGSGRDRLNGGVGTDTCRNGERVSNCD
jgi:Ca2+-binding RTX toxin-like protein